MIPQKNYTGYSIYRTDGARTNGGVTIYVKSEYPCKIVNINTYFEAIVVSVKLRHLEINICNLYIPNQIDFIQNDIKNILNQIPTPFIITGDINNHNLKWGLKISIREEKKFVKHLIKIT